MVILSDVLINAVKLTDRVSAQILALQKKNSCTSVPVLLSVLLSWLSVCLRSYVFLFTVLLSGIVFCSFSTHNTLLKHTPITHIVTFPISIPAALSLFLHMYNI